MNGNTCVASRQAEPVPTDPAALFEGCRLMLQKLASRCLSRLRLDSGFCRCERDELVHEGYLAVLQARQGYEGRDGVSFLSYAVVFARQAI